MLKLPPKIKVQKDTFSNDTREEIIARDKVCVCKCGKCKDTFYSIHHIVENTKANTKKYGNLLQSKWNGKLLSNYCHANCVMQFKEEKKRLIETFDMLIVGYPEIKNATQEQIGVVMNHLDKFI